MVGDLETLRRAAQQTARERDQLQFLRRERGENPVGKQNTLTESLAPREGMGRKVVGK